MKLATHSGGRVGVVDGAGLTDVTGVLRRRLGHGTGLSLMRQVIADWPAVAPAVRQAGGQRVPLASVTLDPPVPDPSKLIAAPVNYRDHQAEMSQRFHVDGLGVFLKAPSSVLGHGGVVCLPYHDRRFDHEAELALIIGRQARHVRVADALGCVFGYTGLLDMTMRGGEDRSVRKSFDTFTPMGPWVVTADEFGSPADVGLTLSVNGQARQQARTRDLIWDVAHLVAYASSVMTLLPGDVVTTGTPAGVAPVADGDRVSLRVDRVGELAVTVTAYGAMACPTSGAGQGPVPPPPPAR